MSTAERKCFECVHCMMWTEYGTPMHDCRYATDDDVKVRRGTMTQRQYDAKWAVFLDSIDQGHDDGEAAEKCPHYVELTEADIA